MNKQVAVIQVGLALGLGALFYLLSTLTAALFFGVGLTLGLVMLWGDELVGYSWYSEKKGLIDPGLEYHTSKKMITRSLLFIAVLVPLSLFVVTSTASFIGWGLVLSLVAGICIEIIWYQQDYSAFQGRFLQQNTTPLAPEVMRYVPFVSILFPIILFILILL